jgi:hypothetical protein
MAAIGVCWALDGLGDSRVSQPWPGVRYIDRLEQVPRPVHMHIFQIDLTIPGLRFKVTAPGGSREVVRQTTLDFLRAEGAQIAVNAHYFLPFPSADEDAWLIGLAASEGTVYSRFETPTQRYALVADAPALNFTRENHATLVHRDPLDPEGLRTVEPVSLWNVVAGSAQIITDGAVSIPTYRGDADDGGLLEPGGPNGYTNANSWYAVANARTVIGLSRDGHTLTLFTVDRAGGSEGMTPGEVATLLISDYGVWSAINMDGGGSTSMAMEDSETGATGLLNTSSDNPAGRDVASNLAVFLRR